MSKQSTFFYTHSFVDNVWWIKWPTKPCCPDYVRMSGFKVTPEQVKAYDEYVRKAVQAYAIAQENMTPEEEAEHIAELRGAFGEGEEVVDIITGRRYRT